MSGPLGWFWKLVLGRGLRASLQPDLDRLVTTAEIAADISGASPSGAGLA